MTTQTTNQGWDWDKEKIEARVARNRICDICKQSFKSAKRVKQHKKRTHAY